MCRRRFSRRRDRHDPRRSGSSSAIIDHINAVGVLRPLETSDIIYLKQNGVSDLVVQTMQHPARQAVVVEQPAPPPPVVVEDPYYYGPYYHPYGYWHRPPPPGIGVTIVP